VSWWGVAAPVLGPMGLYTAAIAALYLGALAAAVAALVSRPAREWVRREVLEYRRNYELVGTLLLMQQIVTPLFVGALLLAGRLEGDLSAPTLVVGALALWCEAAVAASVGWFFRLRTRMWGAFYHVWRQR